MEDAAEPSSTTILEQDLFYSSYFLCEHFYSDKTHNPEEEVKLRSQSANTRQGAACLSCSYCPVP